MGYFFLALIPIFAITMPYKGCFQLLFLLHKYFSNALATIPLLLPVSCLPLDFFSIIFFFQDPMPREMPLPTNGAVTLDIDIDYIKRGMFFC